MSGVVNIVTKEPTQNYSGKAEYTSAPVNSSSYREQNAIVEDKNPVLNSQTGQRLSYLPPANRYQNFPVQFDLPGELQGSLSGPVPGINNLSFFFSGKYANLDSYLPHGFDLERNYFGKIIYRLSPTVKLNFTENYSKKIFQIYGHDWKYIPQNQGLNELVQRRHILTINHTVFANVFYTLNLSATRQNSNYGVWDWQNNQFLNHESDYQKNDCDNELEFYLRGNDDLFLKSTSYLYSVKGDINY